MIERNNPKRKDLCNSIIENVKENDIKFIYLQFTDIHGIIKSFEINSKRIEDFFDIGESFDGVISGVSSFGLFVELLDHFISGAIEIARLKDDFYHYDEKNHRLVADAERFADLLHQRRGEHADPLVVRHFADVDDLHFRQRPVL